MSAVSHYLEREGIPTTGISLVREHTEAMRPPRALWVPFMLGRPLGVAHDAAFQTEVLRAALALLARDDVPVLADFPRDAPPDAAGDPGGDADASSLACPVAFSRLVPAGDTHAALEAALLEEVAQLAPWHGLATRRRGATTVGLAGATPVEAATRLVSLLGDRPVPAPAGDASLATTIKLACDDLRAYYEEAALAQPGTMDSDALGEWYYRQTIAGDVLARLRARLLDSDDPDSKLLAERMLVPRRWVRA
ncbi:MAG: hypothetical protein AB7H94_08890 [Lautropia sp.]